MNRLQIVCLSVLIFAVGPAWAECQIVLSQCRPLGINSATRFADSYQDSAQNPHRCLQRAREYLKNCKTRTEVGAEFSNNGQLMISAYVTPTTSVLWTKATTGGWVQITGGY